MRTVPFCNVMNGIIARMGLDSTMTPAANTLAAFTEYINSSIRVTWEMYPWPEFKKFEQRQFYPSWNVATAYAPGVIVLGSDLKYYLSVAAGTGQDPTLDVATSFWAPAGSFTPNFWNSVTAYGYRSFVFGSDQNIYVCNNITGSLSNNPTTDGGANWSLLPSGEVGFNVGGILYAISLDQPGQTPIGEVISVTDRDPRATFGSSDLRWMLTADVVVVRPQAGYANSNATVWLQFTVRPQQYTTASYTNGDTIPWVLSESVKYAACACAHREDGQFDKATVMDQLSADVLDDEFDKIEMKQQQTGGFGCLSRR